MKSVLIIGLVATLVFTYLYINGGLASSDDQTIDTTTLPLNRATNESIVAIKLNTSGSNLSSEDSNNTNRLNLIKDEKSENILVNNDIKFNSKGSLKREDQFKNNTKGKLKDHLVGIEAAYITDNNQADFSIIQGIMDKDIFNDFINQLSEETFNNPDTQDVSEQYANSFLDAATNLESGQIELNDFQCGQVSCVGSLTTYGDGVWEEFLASRFPSGYDGDYPVYSLGNFTVANDDGSIEHRIFFSTTDEINGIFIPTGERPTPDGGG